MLGQRRRQWPIIDTTLHQCLLVAGAVVTHELLFNPLTAGPDYVCFLISH